MTAIDEAHVEWATVDRMRQMLSSTRRDFEITQTFTLFTGILCWTLQRIRWEKDDTPLKERMATLRIRLAGEAFEDFLKGGPRPPLRIVGADRPGSRGIAFNDFSAFRNADASLTSLGLLVALRNAVAHGDHRRVIPLNEGQRLRGYRLECQREDKKTVVWEAAVNLDRQGMEFIARRLADRFCNAAIDATSKSDTQAASEIKETAR